MSGRGGGPYVNAVKNRLPPPQINREIRELGRSLCSLLHLGDYETEVFTVLMAAKRPLIASEISNFCTVPRTKIYGTVNKLTKMGLLSFVVIDEDMIEKPKMWDWWWFDEEEKVFGKKQREFLRKHLVGINLYGLNVQYIRDVYFNWTTEVFETKSKIGKVVDYITEHKDNPIPVLDDL